MKLVVNHTQQMSSLNLNLMHRFMVRGGELLWMLKEIEGQRS